MSNLKALLEEGNLEDLEDKIITKVGSQLIEEIANEVSRELEDFDFSQTLSISETPSSQSP